MRTVLTVLLLALTPAIAQNSSPSDSAKSQPSSSAQKTPKHTPNLAPPSSEHVDASSLPDDIGDSSSKDTQIDISPPPNDAKDHPQSGEVLTDEGSSGSEGPMEFHPFDPHKAAKDIEVGDFYFKKKSYRAAEGRYREALVYKDNDAVATYKLAICLERLNRPDEALVEYQNYLKILPYGPEAGEAKKAIERLKTPNASAKPN